MATKKIDFQTLAARLQQVYGDEVIKMGVEARPITRVSTGIPNLDDLLGGGWPKGRIVELCGPSRTGKTTMGLLAAKALAPCLYIDSDNKYDPAYAQTLGIDAGSIIVTHPETLEQAFTIMFTALSLYPLGSIVIDSLTALIPSKELAEKDMSKTTAISPVAVMLSRKLPILNTKINETGAVLLVINQVRDKIGAMPFTNPYNTPGGHQLKGLETLRLVLGNKGQIKDNQIGNIGQVMAVMVEKSSVGASMQRTEVNFINGVGIVDDLIGATNQLRLAAGKQPKRGTEVVIEEVSELDEELERTGA